MKVFPDACLFSMGIECQKLPTKLGPVEASEKPVHHEAVVKHVIDHMLHRIKIVRDEILGGRQLFPAMRALDESRKKIIDFHSCGYTIISMESPLLLRIRKELKQLAHPERAKGMQAYMKSEMPYHGVQTPILRKTLRSIFKEIELPTTSHWQREILALWRNARFREERYAALNLAADKRATEFHTPETMKMFEEMIVTGAWWDYVDDIASHRVGAILARHPAPMKKLMRRWSRSDNLWKRRTSIICQLGFKKNTDLELLYDCIEPSLDSKEFFLQKGIGWALRQYAWTNPGEIKRYVRKNGARLSPLSKREALKNMHKL